MTAEKKLELVFKITVHLVFLVLIGFFVYLLSVDQLAAAFLALLAAAIVLIAARLNDIVRMKFSKDGFETELAKVQESLRETHALAELSARVMLQQLHGAGRFGGVGKAAKEEMRSRIVTGLQEVGIAEKVINSIMIESEYPYSHFDYCSRVTQSANPDMTNEEVSQKWSTFFAPYHNKGIGAEAPPSALEPFLESMGLLVGETKERMEDYKHYHTFKTHRRPKDW